MQKAFKEAEDARFQDQGEVSILRKRMEKVRVEIKWDYFSLLRTDGGSSLGCIAHGGT